MDKLNAELSRALGIRPKPQNLWQQFLYVLAREYERDAIAYRQLEVIQQIILKYKPQWEKEAVTKALNKAHRCNGSAAYDNATDEYIDELLEELENG